MQAARELRGWYEHRPLFRATAARQAPPSPASARDSCASLLWRPRAVAAELDRLTVRQRLAHELNDRRARIPKVLDALLEKAEAGNTQASAELRHWYDQGLGRPEQAQPSVGAVDESTPNAERTPEERALLRGRLIERMIEAEQALGAAGVDARDTPDPPAPPTPANARDS